MATEFIKDELGSKVAVSVSEDRMNAYLQLLDPDPPEHVTSAALLELLQANGIVFGIVEQALTQFSAQPKQYVSTPLLAAKGVPAVNGQDGYIENLTSSEKKERKPLEQQDGKVDYRELMQLNNVTKGQLIARSVPPTKATPGTTVYGESVPGKDGKEARFKVGKNVVVDQEKTRMYAVIDGMVTQTEKGKLNVFPVYEVNGDVDYHIGNIDFIGTVVVRGNVLSGFKIKASGDIRITGGVEGAELTAEGSIDIASGIFAGNKGYVKAGVNVKSSFLQEANVYADQDVIVSQSILHSNVRAGKSVMCNGTKGLIVGGNVQAGELIVARTVGNTMSTATVLEVGVVPELRNDLQQLRASLRAVNENIDKSDKALHILDQMAAAGTLAPDKQELRAKLLSTKRTSAEELAMIKERILELESSINEIDKARITVSGTVYSGTKVVIGRYTRFVKDPATRVVFQLQGGEITLTSN